MSDAAEMRCPDPQQDWEGYCLWCEAFACAACDGMGEDFDEDTGVAWVCPRCGGSGIDAPAESDEEIGDAR